MSTSKSQKIWAEEALSDGIFRISRYSLKPLKNESAEHPTDLAPSRLCPAQSSAPTAESHAIYVCDTAAVRQKYILLFISCLSQKMSRPWV